MTSLACQNLQETQCVFIRGFRAIRVLGVLPSRLKRAGGPNLSLDGDRGHDGPDKNLVLMEVDFPRGKEQTRDVRQQNQNLAMQYNIAGFPTIVVLNADGKIVGELGYMEGGPTAFISELEKLRKS